LAHDVLDASAQDATCHAEDETLCQLVRTRIESHRPAALGLILNKYISIKSFIEEKPQTKNSFKSLVTLKPNHFEGSAESECGPHSISAHTRGAEMEWGPRSYFQQTRQNGLV